MSRRSLSDMSDSVFDCCLSFLCFFDFFFFFFFGSPPPSSSSLLRFLLGPGFGERLLKKCYELYAMLARAVTAH